MAPWLRTLSSAGLLLLLAAAPTHASYTSSVAPPAASYAVEPDPAESRAGSRAGVGRERPGREPAPGEDDLRPEIDPGVPEVPDIPVGPLTTASADVGSEPSPHAAPPPPSEPVLRVLPLGSGLVLIGLGLGLAFLGLRVRRG
ncbi:hypothetical protein [Streptomyces pseudoechinosporeus]